MGKGTKWTEQEDRTLRIMVKRGETDAAVADAIGRSVKAVESMRRKLGVQRGRKVGGRSPWTEFEDDTLIIMRGQGKAAEQIARAVGRTVPAVWHRAKSLGLTGGDYEKPEAQQQTLFEAPELKVVKPRTPEDLLREQIDGLNGCVAALNTRIGDLTQIAAENEESISNLKKIIYALEGWASKPALKRGAYERSK